MSTENLIREDNSLAHDIMNGDRFKDQISSPEDLVNMLKVGQEIIIPTDLSESAVRQALDNSPILAKITELPENGKTCIVVGFDNPRDGGGKPIHETRHIPLDIFYRLLKEGTIRNPLSKERAKELSKFSPEDVTVGGKRNLYRLNDMPNVIKNVMMEIESRFPKFVKKTK